MQLLQPAFTVHLRILFEVLLERAKTIHTHHAERVLVRLVVGDRARDTQVGANELALSAAVPIMDAVDR